MQWTLVDGKITIGGLPLKEHSDRLIKKAFEIGDLLILLVDYLPATAVLEQNVIAIDKNGDLKWRIKKPPRISGANPVTELWLKDGKLLGYLPVGMEILIDPLSGDWINNDPDNRPW